MVLKLLFLLMVASGLNTDVVELVVRGLGVRAFLNFCRKTITSALCSGSWGERGPLRERSGVPPGDLNQHKTVTMNGTVGFHQGI